MSGFYGRWWSVLGPRQPPLDLERRRRPRLADLLTALGLGAAVAFGAWVVVRLIGVYVLRWCV